MDPTSSTAFPYTALFRSRNEGTLSWSSGVLVLGQASSATTIENAGLFEAQGDDFLIVNCCGAVAPLVHNTGTFRKRIGRAHASTPVTRANGRLAEAQAGT